ncbi:MAG: hypothetical protein KDJ88_11660 [Bauldia sp.]|nr:hypothetical protein [Bauldia sp.]
MASEDGPDRDQVKRIVEEAEEGLHERLDDPGAPLEEGPIERGRVDAGPTGQRDGGYRQPESGNRIMWIGGIAIVVIVIVAAISLLG